MSLVKTVTAVNSITEWALKLIGAHPDQKLEFVIDDLVSLLEKEDRSLVKPLIKNTVFAQRQFDISPESVPRPFPLLEKVEQSISTAKLAAEIAQKLINTGIKDLVSVQPMSAPVGLAFKLVETTRTESEGMTNVGLQIVSFPVEARSRKLQAGFCVEAAQDIKLLHDLDAESELRHVIACEIAEEITCEIVAKIKDSAECVGTIKLSGSADNIADKHKALLVKITNVANQIGNDTHRGVGNVILCGPEGSVIMTTSPEFVPLDIVDDAYNVSLRTDLQLIGTYAKKFSVFRSSRLGPNVIVGYKSKSSVDAGLFYCPYVLFKQTASVVNPVTFQPVIGFVTRHGWGENEPSGFYKRFVIE